jgi:hypothetical protein
MDRETELICKAQYRIDELLRTNASNKAIRLAVGEALDEDDVDLERLEKWKRDALERLDDRRFRMKVTLAHKLTIPPASTFFLWVTIPFYFGLQLLALGMMILPLSLSSAIVLLLVTAAYLFAYRVRWVHFRDLSLAEQLDQINQRNREWRSTGTFILGAISMIATLLSTLYMTNPDIAKFAEYREAQGFDSEQRRVVDLHLLSVYEAKPATGDPEGFFGLLGRFYRVPD